MHLSSEELYSDLTISPFKPRFIDVLCKFQSRDPNRQTLFFFMDTEKARGMDQLRVKRHWLDLLGMSWYLIGYLGEPIALFPPNTNLPWILRKRKAENLNWSIAFIIAYPSIPSTTNSDFTNGTGKRGSSSNSSSIPGSVKISVRNNRSYLTQGLNRYQGITAWKTHVGYNYNIKKN